MQASAITQSRLMNSEPTPPQVARVSVRRVSHRELHVCVELSRAVHDETWVEVSLGYVCIHQKDNGYSLAVSLPHPLWKPGWLNQVLEPCWNDAHTRFEVSLVLPEKFERIPDSPEVVCDSPAEVAWPFMSPEEWKKRTEPHG